MIRIQGIKNSHIYLARTATVVDGVTVSSTVKPDYDPASNWRKLSTSVSTMTVTPQRGQELNLMATVGGHQQLRRKVRTGPASTEFTFTQGDEDMIIQELEMMTGAINDSAATATGSVVEATPFAGTLDGITGWYQVQQYNQDDELVRIYVVWGELMLEGGNTSGNAQTEPKLKLTVFPNALNKVYHFKPTDAL